MAFTFYLGLAGALVAIDTPAPDYAPPLIRLGGSHDLLSGGLVRDTIRYRRTHTLTFRGMTLQQYADLERLYVTPGPYRYVDPTRINLLTANQSTGSDALRDTTGFSAPFQGTVSSDTTQLRTGTRSLKWDTVTSLSVTNRGVYFPTSGSTIDQTWAAVIPNTPYTFSAYVRANAAITMYAAIDWKDAAGTTISTDFGTGTAVSTSDWSTRLTCANKTSPSTAAYAIPAVLDSVAPSAIRQVWIDDAQLEQATAASAWVVGTGVPLVTVDSLVPDFTDYAADAAAPAMAGTLVLLEI